MKGLNIQMIIELNKPKRRIDIDFTFPYIERALNIAKKEVFTKIYPRVSDFESILPPFLQDETIEFQLNITFVDADEMRELNFRERGKDYITDVLSFPALEMNEGVFPSLEEYHFYPLIETADLSAEEFEIVSANDFDAEVSDNFVSDTKYILELGDLVICLDRTREQADEYRHSFTREISFLALHGFLHLIGFDHEISPEVERRMFAIQDEVLGIAGITRDMEDDFEIDWDIYSESKDIGNNLDNYSEGNLADSLKHVSVSYFDNNSDEEFSESSNGNIIKSSNNISELNEKISSTKDLINQFLATDKVDLSEDESVFDENFKTGYVAILGRPNAGKSTLLNVLAGDELAITSPKAKTTRHNIKAVIDDGSSQIIFIDTPGIHRAENKLERYMASSAWSALEIANVVLLLVDPRRSDISEVEITACKKARDLNLPIILVLTKTDISIKEKLLPLIKKYTDKFDFADVVPISSMENDNITVLLDVIREHLPLGSRKYSQYAYTDQSERALAAEYIREEILAKLYQEVPHDVAVQIDKFEEKNNDRGERSLIVIEATILVSRETQKGIIVGKAGKMIKRIGIKSREKLEELYGAKVYLELFVRVQDDWKNKDRILNDLGYTSGKNGPAELDIIE